MPLYEYACKECHSSFELLIRGDEKPECPGCGSRRLDKLLSVPAAHTAASSSLPMCNACPASAPSGCGLGQCGMGGCGMQM